MKSLIASLVFCFALVLGTNAAISSLEALEILKMVQSSALEAEKHVVRVPAIFESMSKDGISDEKLRQLLYEYIIILDGTQNFDERNNLDTILKWIVDRISSSSGLIFPLRVARVSVFAADAELKKLKNDWDECAEKLNRSPDFGNEEDKFETIINVDMFVQSLDSLKRAIVQLDRSVKSMEKYVLREEPIDQ